jgi:peptidoglycan/LPS O-acetylase OafA/YrhL
VSPARSSPRHVGALDGFRGIAALGVAVSHVWLFVRGDGTAPDSRLLTGVLGEGRLGMPLFFVLSGFLIFRPFAAAAIDGRPQPRPVPYAVRRLARIVPAYWLVMIVAAVLLAHLAHPLQQPLSALPSFLLFLQNYDPATHGGLNPPTWSVGVEMSFYLAVPLLGLAAAATVGRMTTPRERRLALAGVCFGLTVAGSYLIGQGTFHEWDATVTDTLPVRMGSFGVGMLVAVLAHDRTVGRRGATGLVLAGLTLVAVETASRIYVLGSEALRDQLMDTPVSVGFGLIIAAVVLGRPAGGSVLASSPLRKLGDWSFGLYLVHYPVIAILRSTERFPQDPLLAEVVVIGISLAIAALLWRFVESPSIAWAHRRTPSRRTAPRPVLGTARSSSGD